MQIKYFNDTDTLYIEFNKNQVFETKDLNENILLDLDDKNNIVAITIEHAKSQTNISNFSVNFLPESEMKKVNEFELV